MVSWSICCFVSFLRLWGKFALIQPKTKTKKNKKKPQPTKQKTVLPTSATLKAWKRTFHFCPPYLLELWNCSIIGSSQGIMLISLNSMNSKRSQYVHLCGIFTSSDSIWKKIWNYALGYLRCGSLLVWINPVIKRCSGLDLNQQNNIKSCPSLKIKESLIQSEIW